MAENFSERIVKIRVQSKDHEAATSAIIRGLEEDGYELIEWSKEYPLRDDPEIKRVFLTAIKKFETEDSNE